MGEHHTAPRVGSEEWYCRIYPGSVIRNLADSEWEYLFSIMPKHWSFSPTFDAAKKLFEDLKAGNNSPVNLHNAWNTRLLVNYVRWFFKKNDAPFTLMKMKDGGLVIRALTPIAKINKAGS